MNNYKIIPLFIFFIFFNISSNYSKNIFEYTNSKQEIFIDKGLYYLYDETNKLSIKDIIQKDDFIQSNAVVPNLGVTNSTIWCKIIIKNNTDNKDLLLKIEYPNIDEIELFNNVNEVISTIKMGEIKPFNERKYDDPNYIFDIEINKGETNTYYFKVKSGEQILFPIKIGTQKSILENISKKNTIAGIYLGIILAMFLYNIFLYFTVKDSTYLYYVIYILLVGLTQLFLHGYTFKYLWPNSSWLAIHSMYLLPSLVGIAISEFAKKFLQINKFSIHLKKGFIIINSIYCICILLALLGQHNQSQQIIHINAMLVSIYTLIVGLYISFKGFKPAIFFSIAWFAFLIGVCIFILKDFGIMPYNNFTVYAMPFGSAIEVILLSFALADRINILKKEKQESQLLTFETLKENERIIREQNTVLEQKVNERTTKLEESIANLKQTQSKLVDAEKMASLGQLTAGIAHEINNPINFVISSVTPLRRDVNDLNELIEKYDSIQPNSNLETELTKINAFKKEIDYDYLKTEIQTLLKGIDEGANRTSEIVKGLRTFSRIDESDLKRVNIIDGIDSTLSLLNSNLGNTITVTKKYTEVPAIECFPGKLNQVFMNILSNAIHAIDLKNSNEQKGEIIISTFSNDTTVIIKIQDNGSGMKQETIQKVFEPFYTTKDVGKGTGLGMSISKSIIDDHNGTIEIDSEVGTGTTFTLTLPINQK